MKYEVILTKKFNKQFNKLAKKHYPVDNVFLCVKEINNKNKFIMNKIKDHPLHGSWQGFRAFHPARLNQKSNDDGWIVIYKIEKGKLIITLVQTGNHDLY